MPGMFIDVEVAEPLAGDPAAARKLAEVCPVGIFELAEGRLHIVEENLDECVLCMLCVDAAPPGSVRIHRLYEESPRA